MDVRIRNLAIAALVPLAICFTLFRVTSDTNAPKSGTDRTPRADGYAVPTSVPSPSPETGRTYSYAIDLLSLAGIPPDLEPGSPVELWVTWSSGQRASQPEKWVTGATFQRIVPAVTPAGPDVAILEIPADARRKMVWADTFGLLTLFATR